MREAWHIVVAGAGGNTGSLLIPHVARMPDVMRLTLVDPDAYEQRNLPVQDIAISDVKQSKARVQAARVESINPGVHVLAFESRIEDLPRGLLRCDLIVSCLDSRAARQFVNEIAFRLGVSWIDCGVLGGQNLARVNAYDPSMSSPCVECPWGPADYALIEQEYICGASGGTRPTMASSALGALAASLVAMEIPKLLGGDRSASLIARQLIVDARHHRLITSKLARNTACRFDHGTWSIAQWPCRLGSTTVGEALSALGELQIAGHRFVRALVCPGCGWQSEGSLRLNRPFAHCIACGRRMASPGFDARDQLGSGLEADSRALTLAQVGLRAGDLVSAGDCHYELVEEAA